MAPLRAARQQQAGRLPGVTGHLSGCLAALCSCGEARGSAASPKGFVSLSARLRRFPPCRCREPALAGG